MFCHKQGLGGSSLREVARSRQLTLSLGGIFLKLNLENKFFLETNIFKEGLISHELINPLGDRVGRWVMDTMEKQTKEALIKLGWTPPNPSFQADKQVWAWLLSS